MRTKRLAFPLAVFVFGLVGVNASGQQLPGQVLGSAFIPASFSSRISPTKQDLCNVFSFADSDIWSPDFGGNLHSVVTVDINGDNYCDLFLTFFGDEYVSIPAQMYFYNPVSARFDNVSDRVLNNEGTHFSRKTVAADFNSDGIWDFAAINTPEYRDGSAYRNPSTYLKAWLSASDTTWTEQLLVESNPEVTTDGSIEKGAYFHGMSAGDINGDGFDDIVLANGNVELGSIVLRGDGSGGFTVHSAFTESYKAAELPTVLHTADLADFNGDDCLDLIGTVPSNPPPINTAAQTIIVYGNCNSQFDADGFQVLADYGPSPSPWGSMDHDWIDFDNDGKKDLILSLAGPFEQWDFCWCPIGEMRIFLNTGLDSTNKILWSDSSEAFNNYIRGQGFYEDASTKGWVAFLDVEDLNNDGFIDITRSVKANSNSDLDWVLLGTAEPLKFTYADRPIGSTPGYWDEVTSLSASDLGQRVRLRWFHNGQWMPFNPEARFEILASTQPFGDPNTSGLWRTTVTATMTEVELFPAGNAEVRIDLSIPDSLSYVRVLPINKHGLPSVVSNMAQFVAVPNMSPVAGIGASSSVGQAPFAITFDASSSSDPNSDPLTYAWDFGDGATGSGESVSHTYTAAGEYTVVLTASDGVLTGTDSLTVSIASGVDTESFELPESFVLRAAYPNPFNPTTTVTYGLPAASEVRITATDLLGRQVATLVSGDMKAAGYHTAQFNADGLASGTYLIRMEAGDFVATQQVVLLK